MLRIGLILSLTLFISHVSADILFLDLNNSPKEIEAAKKAASVRGEKVIVVPNSKTVKWVNDNNISALLADLKKKNVKLSSVVMSGHDGNGQFHGTSGKLNETALENAFKKNKPLGDNVKSLLLWGCYTTNLDGVSNVWNKTLPHLDIMAGFDGKAPFNDKISNFTYLEDFLTQEKKLAQIKDINQLQKAFKKLRNVNQVTSSMCTNGNYVTPTMKMAVKDFTKMCNQKIFSSIAVRTNCYIKGLKGCTTVPTDTAHGALRKLYEDIQGTVHCADLMIGYVPDPETILRLIFYKNVVKNFADINKTGLDLFNKKSATLGLAKEFQFDNLASLSRLQIINKLKAFAIEIDKKIMAAEDKFSMNYWFHENTYNKKIKDLKTLRTEFALLQKTLGEVDSLHIPIDWIDKKPITTLSPELNFLMEKDSK